MIKTFVYNEFDFSNYSVDKNKFIQEIEDFSKSGGNLNHPVKDGDKIISAFKFLEDKFGVEFVTSLFLNKTLESPGNWTLNLEEKAIVESNLFNSYWYRDNAHNYRKVIAEGFKKTCQEYLKNPIYSEYHYVDNYNSNKDSKVVKNNLENPLLSILLRIPLKEILEVFLKEVPNAKELLNQSYYKDHPYYHALINLKDNEDNLLLLFKNHILDVETLIKNYKFNNFIRYAIHNNDFEFMNLLKNKSNNPNYIGELDKENSMYDSFLRSVNTPEMAKLLIDSGCPVIKNNSEYDSMLFSSKYFSISKIDTIKFIMEYVPLDYMGKYRNIFWEYLDDSNNLEEFKEFTKFIVSKGFPLENYDLFSACPDTDIPTKIKTCIDLGANVNNCSVTIDKLVSRRDTSSFKAIQKTKLLNLYSPDGIYYLLKSGYHTKTTLDLIDKAETSNLNSMTSFGKPAWFSSDSNEKLHKILKRITSFNQIDSDGNNWITHYYSQNIKEKNSIAPIVLEMASLEESKNKQLLNLTYKENTSNLLHYGFTFNKNGVKELKDEFITIIKSFNTTNLNELIGGIDQNGLFPIDYLIKSKSEEGVWNHSFWDSKFDNILKIAEYNLDYDKKNINGETLINKIRFFYTIDNKFENFIDLVEKAYLRYTLYNKLDSKLVLKNKKSNSIKI